MKNLVDNYAPKIAPAINVPKVGIQYLDQMELCLEARKG